MSLGRAEHSDNRILVAAAKPFEAGLKILTDRHPELLKAFGTFSEGMTPKPSKLKSFKLDERLIPLSKAA